MTITCLVTGKLIADPEKRVSAAGKVFTKARVVAGTDDESALVSIVAFGSVAEQLAELSKGDTVSVTGRAKPSAWTGRDGDLKAGLDVVADQLLTVYHLRKKRAAMAGAAAPTPEPESGRQARSGGLGGAREQAPDNFDNGSDDAWLAGQQQ